METAPQSPALDDQTIEVLEHSLSMKILKLFAIMTKADQVVSDEERQFVADYWRQVYPEEIAVHLFGRFETFLETGLDLDQLTQAIRVEMSYQEKLFCLMKMFELIASDEIDERELEMVWNISRLLDLDSADLSFIENYFRMDGKLTGAEKSSIIRVRISDDPNEADIYMPLEGLDIDLFKVFDLYCLSQKGTDHYRVLVDGQEIRPDTFNRIPHNGDILINQYTIKYQDLRIYFENKVHPLNADLFLSRHENHFSWDQEQKPGSTLHLRLEGSRLELAPLKSDLMCQINGARVYQDDDAIINMDDEVEVDGNNFNIREVFFHLNREKIIRLPQGLDRYEITNDARGDVFIADTMTDKWKAVIHKKDGRYFFSLGDCPYQAKIGGRPVKIEEELPNGKSLFLHNRHLWFDFEKGTIRQVLFSFEKLDVDQVKYAFADGSLGLNDINFEVSYGELVCIMGPSGCGKSTLLNLITGLMRPLSGRIQLGDMDLESDFDAVKDYLGFVPQDDLLLANLTVYENLFYYAKLRFPDRKKSELDAQIDLVLQDVGLFEKKDILVGSPVDKTLSGGQRKRLNIGLELLSNAELLLLDEPTSGLSSKDSENIIELLANIAARGKIVLTVIHQPSSRIYAMFDKIVLLDTGGFLAYFGPTKAALTYFAARKSGRPEEEVAGQFSAWGEASPDILLDTLEESLRDLDGSRLQERKYPPQFWSEQFLRYREHKDHVKTILPKLGDRPPAHVLSAKDRFSQLKTLISRNFKNKLRDKSNLLITFLGAPALGWGVGWVTKSAPQGQYWLYTNDLFDIFLFTAVIASLFFGMTNSVDEIISARPIFLRERLLSVRPRSYLTANVLVLIVFAVLQNILYLATGFWVLEVKELYWEHVGYLSLVSWCGIGIGLFVSAIPNISSKAAQNIIPIILIPQLILGGALIKFNEMNEKIWFFGKSPIPEISQIMPSRWAYEGLVVLQATHNRFDETYDAMGRKMNEMKRNLVQFRQHKEEYLQKHGEAAYDREVRRLREEIQVQTSTRDQFMVKEGRLYGNSNIRSHVARADAEKPDSNINQMFVSRKNFPGFGMVGTVFYDTVVMFLYGFVLLLFALAMLRYREGLLRTARTIKTVWRKPSPKSARAKA